MTDPRTAAEQKPAGRMCWQDPGRDLVIRTYMQPPPGYAMFLEQQAFGSEGLRYRRLGMAERLAHLPGAHFLSLEHKGQLAGSYVLMPLVVHRPQGVMDGCYRGLLSVTPKWQGQGLGAALVSVARELLAADAAANHRPLLGWGCIESDNTRSLRTLQASGGVPLGVLESSTVYRQWPREKVELVQLDPQQQADIQAAVLECQSDCALRMAQAGGGSYYAVTGEAGILAGARVLRTQVDMLNIGGAWDFLDRHLLRYSKAARRRFDPHCFTYLSLSELVIRPGLEKLWPRFLSSLLARHGCYMAMLVLDPRSRLHQQFSVSGLFRRGSRINRNRMQLMGMSWNEADSAVPADGPLGIGPLGF